MNDSLLISNGIHKNEIRDKGIKQVAKEYEMKLKHEHPHMRS